MEFVKGTELVKMVQKRGGRMDAQETLKILKNVVYALDTVHKAGLVHRDISPDNLILTKEGKLPAGNAAQATFTVSNLGSFGIESFTPVINPPQTGILGVCGTIDRVRKAADGSIEIYPAMGLSLTYDHRAVDGTPASKFLQELCKNLENFTTLLAK